MKIEDHIVITDYAVDLYWMFSNTELAENYKQNIKKIQEGAKSAGKRIIKSRSRNLHFYNHGNRLKPKKVKLLWVLPLYTLYPTSEYYLRNCIDELGKEMADGISSKAYVLIGNILHLIQDLSSPPNVVPVFHSLITRDSFEDRLNSRMKLYMSNYTLSQEGFDNVCDELKYHKDKQCIELIYRDAASRTIDYIRSKKTQFDVKIDGELKKSGWDLFWKNYQQQDSRFSYGKRPGIDGFGRYGPLGKHFGQEQITIFSKKYEIHKNIYEKLSNFVVRKAIEDSIRVLCCVGH